MTLKRIGSPLVGLLMMASFSACQKEAVEELKKLKPEIELSEFYSSTQIRKLSVRLDSDTVYILSSNFTRQSGEELIIDPGTVIKCSRPYGITIQKGGKLFSRGAVSAPIVFTSIMPLGTQQSGDWNGLVIQGNAPSNNGTGGNAASDNSGVLTYTRIEFAGLHLQNLGNQTEVHHVQVSYAGGNESIRVDGGTVRLRNILSYAANTPYDMTITNGYTGAMQDVMLYRHPFFPASTQLSNLAGLYIINSSGGNGNATPQTYPIISNLTVLGPDSENNRAAIYNDSTIRNGALLTSGNAGFAIRNSIFAGYISSGWFLDDIRTAENIQFGRVEFNFNVVENPDTARAYYLRRNAYPAYTSQDFTNFMIQLPRNNCRVTTVDTFQFMNPYNFDNPNPLPMQGTEILTGANFSGPRFSNAFFSEYAHRGAMGVNNWFEKWVNFQPLKTDYNQYY